MDPTEWRQLEDAELERLLVERWLFRGALVTAMTGAAAVMTYLGLRGLTTWRERVEVGIFALLTIGAGAWLFIMRRRDLAIHRELHRRRKS